MAAPRTLADVWVPNRSNALVRDFFLILGASMLISLCAQVTIRLPWTPVPITGQTLGVLLAGVSLGKRRGTIACLAYLTEGAAGLPVFAGGTAGILPFLGPTAGYLIAFPISAYLVGALAEKGMDRNPWTALVAMFMGSVVILFLGSLYLSLLFGNVLVGFAKGFLPFVVGDIVKTEMASLLLPLAWRVSKSGAKRGHAAPNSLNV